MAWMVVDRRQVLANVAVLALASSPVALAAGCEDEPFKSAVEARLQGKESRLISCRMVPGDRRLGVAVVAVEGSRSTDDVKTYDVSLLLLDAANGKVRADATLENVWQSDAYKIDGIEVSGDAYPVRRGTTVFGLTEWWSGSSRVSFYNMTKLSLYAQRGTKLVPVLSDLVTEIYQGEGCDVQTTRAVDVQPVSGAGYASIRVSGKREGIARDGAECPAVDPVEAPEVLVVRDGKYVVPKRLGPFDSE